MTKRLTFDNIKITDVVLGAVEELKRLFGDPYAR